MKDKETMKNLLKQLGRIFALCAGLGLMAIAKGADVKPQQPFKHPTFAEWQKACANLPTNRTLKRAPAPKEILPLNAAEFNRVLDAFLEAASKGALANTNHWLGAGPASDQFLNIAQVYFAPPNLKFEPFVQRLQVPSGAQVFLHGDLHGDIHSLNGAIAALEQRGLMKDFKIQKENFWMVFLGDYTDRGLYGVEVIATLLRLKLENPERVILVRGNHEDVLLTTNYGFLTEAQLKFEREFDLKKTMRIYDFLPVALYLTSGPHAVQCNHGGMEPGFSPPPLLDAPDVIRYEFLGTLRRGRFLTQSGPLLQEFSVTERALLRTQFQDFRPESPTRPSIIGFMWNDFSLFKEAPQFAIDPGRAYVFGDRLTGYLLEKGSGTKVRLEAVFRAHQHSSVPNPMMRRLKAGKGLFRHWQETDGSVHADKEGANLTGVIETSSERSLPRGSVWTFNVVPDSVYGTGCDYSFDTFGLLRTGDRFSDWKMEIINIEHRF